MKNILWVIFLTLRLGSVRAETEHEKIFTPLFQQRPIDKMRESYSGIGSTLENTKAIRRALPGLLYILKCETLIDAPCGDFNWMKSLDLPIKKYIGIDVIQSWIENNQHDYGNQHRTFLHLDITEQVLPKGDVVLTRDALIHFSNKDIAKFLKLLKASGSRYLLTTHFPKHTSQEDINTGEVRPINLELPPFNFPIPLLTISEEYPINPIYADKCLALWKIEKLPDVDFSIIQHRKTRP